MKHAVWYVERIRISSRWWWPWKQTMCSTNVLFSWHHSSTQPSIRIGSLPARYPPWSVCPLFLEVLFLSSANGSLHIWLPDDELSTEKYCQQNQVAWRWTSSCRWASWLNSRPKKSYPLTLKSCCMNSTFQLLKLWSNWRVKIAMAAWHQCHLTIPKEWW